jgi:uncharacterized circularly permuted ATP-grasp superfamily protein/uncharacterized alpha-E superfamily protein
MAGLPMTDGQPRKAMADRWIAEYCASAPGGDVLCKGASDPGSAWHAMLDEVAGLDGGDLIAARDRVQRQADDIGTGFRMPGEVHERPWPLSPLPLLINEQEWAGIAEGIAQRADLMETLLTDIYGDQQLIGGGLLPGALITGSPYFLRPMVGVSPPGGYHLQFYAADLARGPGGGWRILADHTRTPTGAGYALENRLALSRAMGGLQVRLNIHRLAPFFSDFREGLAAVCKRADPRIGLLTPGRFNQSYAEQAHLARYLGLLLVEGSDLSVHDERLYVRTIEGLKRVDALWRRVDPRMLDPLAFDSRSQIGVPGLIDAMAAGNAVIANTPGAGVLESPAMSAFLPRLSLRLTGAELKLPNIATWWCGQQRECDAVIDNMDSMLIAPAFNAAPAALPDGKARLGTDIRGADRDALLADLKRRPLDYVGQEVVKLSTTAIVGDAGLVPRPFTVRVFAARDVDGRWSVMPGGFVRIGEQADVRAAVMGDGTWSADLCIIGAGPVPPVSLLPSSETVQIRRNPGTLPSRVADNLYWLGRYLERGEGVLGLVRAALGGSIDADGGAGLSAATIQKLGTMLIASGAAAKRAGGGDRGIVALAHAALDDIGESASVRAIGELARDIGEGSRERLSADFWRLLDAPPPKGRSMIDRATTYQQRYAALAGLSAEHMGRTDAWRFLDLGRRIERAVVVCRLLRTFAGADATTDDLTALLDLNNSQISYRQRYLTGMALVPVRDLVGLDPGNPRSLAYQVERIGEHLGTLPSLRDDGMAEEQVALAVALSASVATATAETFDGDTVQAIENRLLALSDAIARRFFLRGSEALRAPGLTLA